MSYNNGQFNIFMNKFDKISFKIFLVIVFLSPIFFIPTASYLLDFSKSALMVFGFALILALTAWNSFRQGSVLLPRGPVVWGAAGILIAMLVSTIFSPSWLRSLVSQGFETTSLIFVLTMFVVAYIASITLSTKNSVNAFVIALLGGYSLTAIIQIIRLFVPVDTFTLGVFSGVKSMTLFGSWHDMALWSALALIISACAITFKLFNPKLHKLSYAVFTISFALLIIVNSFAAWVAIIVMTVVYIIFLIKNKDFSIKLKQSNTWLLLVPAIVAIVFMINGGSISNKVYAAFNIPPNSLQFNRIALSLPLKETLTLGSDVLSSRPIFGASPMRFQYEYFKHKPEFINSTDAWAIEFFSGYGYILTSIIEQGIAGLIFWVIFLFGTITLIVRAMKAGHVEEDKYVKFSLTTSALLSISGIVILALFMPAQAMMFVIFLSFGWLMASLTMIGKFHLKPASTQTKNKIIAVLVLVLALLILVIFVRKTLSTIYFNIGAREATLKTPNIDFAHKAFRKAVAIEPLDVNYQALAQLAIYSANDKFTKLQTIDASDKAADQNKQDLIKAVQDDIAESVNSAKAAVDADPGSYYNYLTEARISSALISIQVQNAKENALRSYNDAIAINPTSPSLLLERAQLAYDLEDWAGAKEFIGKALALRPNYIEAVFLLTQVQIKEGSIDAAIVSATQALNLNPNLPILHFQLGLLRFYNKEYTQAIEALQKAIAITPEYANARYFLGLSYSKLGKVEEAIHEFEIVLSYNKDNADVITILDNLRSGKPPFPSGIPAAKLPITEKTKK